MSKTVLVTGASGFIALHCIRELLEQGYRVRATLRTPHRENEVRSALTRAGAGLEALEFAQADLMSDNNWDRAAEGCAYALHVASPFPAAPPKDENELIRPARDGAVRVLKACADSGVKRVVLTSSVAAIAYGHPFDNQRVFSEKDWSDDQSPTIGAYEKSKTLAERAAWAFIATPDAKGMELNTINPGAVLGPLLSADSGTSAEIVRQLMTGALPACPRVGFACVDVRDVARAHVAAMTSAQARQRYLMSAQFAWFKDIADILQPHLAPRGLRVPTGELPDFIPKLLVPIKPELKSVVNSLGRTYFCDGSKVTRELNIGYRSLEEMTISMADSLLALGIVKAR